MLVVNVLDKKLYDECHIAGSINVPFTKVRTWARKIPRDTIVVFYCSNYLCTASGQAARTLLKIGFAHVYAYEAGMHEWYHAGLPTVCTNKSNYLEADNLAPEEKIEKGIAVVATNELKNMMIEHGFFK